MIFDTKLIQAYYMTIVDYMKLCHSSNILVFYPYIFTQPPTFRLSLCVQSHTTSPFGKCKDLFNIFKSLSRTI